MKETFDRFLAWEVRERMFAREIGGVRYWHLVRFTLFMRMLIPTMYSVGHPHPDLEGAPTRAPSFAGRVVSRLRRGWKRILDATLHNPDWAFATRPILFSLIPRQGASGDGRRVSVMLDFLTPRLKSAYALLEYPTNMGFTEQPRGRRVFHLRQRGGDWDRCAREPGFVRTTVARRAETDFILDSLQREFGCTVDVARLGELIDGVLLFRAVNLPRYERWLRRLRTRVVVTAVHYDRENLILAEAAHGLGIPVVELQHGIIYPEHAAYNLPERGSVYSPDRFFAWGSHWSDQIRNYPNGATECVGYPFLDHFRTCCPHVLRAVGEPYRVLFVSQGGVGRQLAHRAVELRAVLPPKDFRIVYKLHPNESRIWRSRYPELAASGVDVVENTEQNIYQCFQKADVTVGVSSSSLIEGFVWGLRALILREFPESEIMAEYCRGRAAEYVDGVAELAERLRQLSGASCSKTLDRFDASRYWEPDAAARTAAALDRIVAESPRI